MGKALLESTPYFGLVFASTVNLFFSRSKDLTEGICVNDPSTGEKIETAKSKECGLLAFKDGLIIRWLLPIPGIIPFYQLTLQCLFFRDWLRT